MEKITTKNMSGIINSVVIVLLTVGYLFKIVRENWNLISVMSTVLSLIWLSMIIYYILCGSYKKYIFLLGTLNISLLMLFEILTQITNGKLEFIVEEYIALLILVLIMFYKRADTKMFLQISIIFLFVAMIFAMTTYSLEINLSNIMNQVFSWILVGIIAFIAILVLNSRGIWENLYSNAEIFSKIIEILYASIICLAILSTSSESLNYLLILLSPVIITTFLMYVFRKEILVIFKDFGIVIFFIFPFIMLSVPIAAFIQLYSSATFYKVFIAILLIISAFLTLILSSDNINNVIEDKNIDREFLDKKFSKTRMLIGNIAIFFTVVSILVDNFYNKLKVINTFNYNRGIVIVSAIWIVGGVASLMLMRLEEKILKATVKAIKELTLQYRK